MNKHNYEYEIIYNATVIVSYGSNCVKKSVSNIHNLEKAVHNLVAKCNEFDLSPIHLENIVDDAAQEFLIEREYEEFIGLLRYFVEISESKLPVLYITNSDKLIKIHKL